MQKITIVLALISLIACDLNQSPDEAGTIFLKQLTTDAGTGKLWKINKATLVNYSNQNEINIDNLANVRDDEFIFKPKPGNATVASLIWNRRNQINLNATRIEEVLMDYYLSPSGFELTIHEDGQIVATDPNLTGEVTSEESVTMRYKAGTSELTLELTPQSEQTIGIPTILQFEKVSEITGKGIEQAAGFTGSMATNSLYLAYRSLEGDFPERVLKYDLSSGSYTSQDFVNPDFVTKELHIINDELKIIGGRYINTYSLNLDKEPKSALHNRVLTRFGSTVVDKEVLLFGGDLSFVDSVTGQSPNAKIIYTHDQQTGQLNQIGSLPESRYWAHGEIMDGKLYVFGGRQTFTAAVAEDDIFVWDRASVKTETFKLPKPMHRTFTARYEHWIVVGGQREIEGSNNTFEIETTLGIFDTHNNTFHTIPTSLDLSGKKTIYGLTVVDNKLYILVGRVGEYAFTIYQTQLPKAE